MVGLAKRKRVKSEAKGSQGNENTQTLTMMLRRVHQNNRTLKKIGVADYDSENVDYAGSQEVFSDAIRDVVTNSQPDIKIPSFVKHINTDLAASNDFMTSTEPTPH